MRLCRLEIQGFRSFGAQAQSVDLRGPIATIYGPNSQGKTSLAEALEFLLTGTTVRRELVASAVREFSNALRNAHLDREEEVIVTGVFEAEDGTKKTAVRRLVRDFAGRGDCEHELLIDGVEAESLETLGIRLAQPPLAAPILMQHTLRYVVSAEPNKRTRYFKALLEVSDLDEIRDAVRTAADSFTLPGGEMEAAFDACSTHALIGPTFRALLDEGDESSEHTERAVRRCLGLFLEQFGAEIPDAFDARLESARALLEERRAATFPMQGFERAAFEDGHDLDGSAGADLRAFLDAKSDTEAQAVTAARLYEELLRIPYVAEAAASVDCPACRTADALTPERVEEIRRSLRATATYRDTLRAADEALQVMRRWARAKPRAVDAATPAFMGWSPEEAEEQGFTRANFSTFLSETERPMLDEWDARCRAVRDAADAAHDLSGRLTTDLENLVVADLDEETVVSLMRAAARLGEAHTALAAALQAYEAWMRPLQDALTLEVDRRQQAQAWSALIDTAGSLPELHEYLVRLRAHTRVASMADAAATRIEGAAAEVLDEKFVDLGDEISHWWNHLRPGEPTSFEGIQRAGTGRRFIDLKARLALTPGAGGGLVRNAVAILSDSQLNCLGLASFLARAARADAGFILLDDPVTASDDDRRALFVQNVLQALVERGVQTIVVTHNPRLRNDIQTAYAHLEIDTYEVSLDSPGEGSRLEDRGHTFAALLSRSQNFIGNHRDEIRKIGARRVREAAERFCKLILVREAQGGGEPNASIADYEGNRGTLGWLVPRVTPLLTNDPSDAGKLRMIGQRLNPGPHDAPPPPPGDLRTSHGDLGALGRAYLRGQAN